MYSSRSRINRDSCIITVCSGKGGAGKTTVARILVELFKTKFKTIAVDAVSGLSGISSFFEFRPTGRKSFGNFLSGQGSVSDYVYRLDRLDIIPSFTDGTIEDLGLERDYERIGELADYIRDNYELGIIDTPSSFDLGLYNYLRASDIILILTESGYQSIVNGYAICKMASSIIPRPAIHFFLNLVNSDRDFDDFNVKMPMLTEAFLGDSYDAIGFLKFDEQYFNSPGEGEFNSMLWNSNKENLMVFSSCLEEKMALRKAGISEGSAVSATPGKVDKT
ncbi:MAG: AAA family ATPase [candidate division Zixibacteria bacterium]|nr:AAA family ATPase [candidate division Zixibacteria bacterium]